MRGNGAGVVFLQPTATHGKRWGKDGECVPCASMRPPYYPGVRYRLPRSEVNPACVAAARANSKRFLAACRSERYTSKRRSYQEYLDAAAVCGDTFNVGGVVSVMRLRPNNVANWVSRAVAAGHAERVSRGVYRLAGAL